MDKFKLLRELAPTIQNDTDGTFGDDEIKALISS